MRLLLSLTPLIIAAVLISCGPGISGENEDSDRVGSAILSTKGLIFYANMNEGEGAISEYFGRAIGSPQGGVKYSEPVDMSGGGGPGSGNSSIGFDGGSACFRFGRMDALKLQPPFTIMAMVNLFAAGGIKSIISSFVNGEQEWSFMVDPSPDLNFRWSPNGTTDNLYTGQTLTVGVWEYVAFTVDASGNTNFFLNSSMIGGAAIGVPIYQSSQDVSIALGCDDFTLGTGNESNFFNGLIDDVAVFNRALSHDEIMRIEQARYQ